jgi:hypothetical protein
MSHQSLVVVLPGALTIATGNYRNYGDSALN